MRTGSLRTWAGLVGLALLAQGPVRAQEAIPIKPAEKPAEKQSEGAHTEKQPVAMPLAPSGEGHGEVHGGHAVESHEAAEGGLASGLVINGEYLFMKARRNALDFAIVAPTTSTLPVGPVESLDWDTRSAFRVGAGWRLPGDGWEILASCTHLDTTDNRTVNAPIGGVILATLTAGGGNDQVNSAFAQTSLRYNVIDLDASKSCCVGDSFLLKFFGGGRLAYIEQQLDATYSGGSLGATPVTVNSPVYYSGAGVTGGMEGTWKLCHGLGIYGRGRLSLLSGTFKTSLTETTSAGNTIVAVNEKYINVIPVTEIGAGISWQNEHWRFAIGYEAANWFNMVNSLDFPDGSSVGHVGRRTSDLMLEGLSVQLGVVF